MTSSGSLQLVDITDPYHLVPAGQLRDRDELLLDGARHVSIFTTSSGTYATVASGGDDGLQTIKVATTDTTKPRFESAVWDERTSAMIITFDETIDASAVNLDKLYVQDATNAAKKVALTEAELYDTIPDSNTLSMIVTSSQRQNILTMMPPQLDIGAGAVSDLSGNLIDAIADREITIIPRVLPPVAPDRTVSTDEDTPVTIIPGVYDSDEGEEAIISAVDDPANGSVTYTDEAITYTPDPDYFGTDIFDYTASAGGDDTPGTITVNVRDTTRPVITLIGRQTMNIYLNDPYKEPGATVSDNDPAYATTAATVGGDTVNTEEAGTYNVKYTALPDAAGNVPREVIRKVIVWNVDASLVTLKGDNPLRHELGEPYNDPGVEADNTLDVEIDDSTVNVDVMGDYTVIIIVTGLEHGAGATTRIVQVRDTTPPVITVTGDAAVTIELGDEYTELGATVSDNDLAYNGMTTISTDAVNTNVSGTYTVTYNAPADDADNVPDPVTRTVTVKDTTPPKIDLNDPKLPVVELGDMYHDPGSHGHRQ